MKRLRWTTLLLACLAACLASACVRTSDGVPVAGESTGTASTPPTTIAPEPVPGVKPTVPDTIPPNALVCLQTPTGTAGRAEVADPVAPRIVVSVPNDWTAVPGRGDVALTLSGPEEMSGSVTIAPTTLDPAEAFTEYADDVLASAAVSSVSVLPAEFCGYSSQRLIGRLSDTPDQAVDFADRITHIWTNSANYLAVVHVQAPVGAAGFDAATSVLMEDFSVVIP